MSKDFFGKKNGAKIKWKNEVKVIDKGLDNNTSLLNNFLKKKGVRVEVLQKKDLPKLRKAFTPEIRKQKVQGLNTITPQIHNQKDKKGKMINKTLETIGVPSKNGRNNSLNSIFNCNKKHIRTLNDRSYSEDSDSSNSSIKKNRNLTFANAINNPRLNKSESVNHEKIKIIDNMIDGLQKLKTLVIEEEGKTRNHPKKIKQSDSLKSQSRKISSHSNENLIQPAKFKIDKTMLEISKILESENENETPKDKLLLKENEIFKKVSKRSNENLNISLLSRSKNSNFFKNAIKRDSPITILNNFSENVKLLTKDLLPKSNLSISQIRSSNENSFLNSNPKIERANAYTSCINNNLFDNSLSKLNNNIVFKVMDQTKYKQIRLDKSIELSKEQNNSAISFKTNKFKIKDILNSNGNQRNISFDRRPISIINKSFNLTEENEQVTQKTHIENNLLESTDKLDKIRIEECVKNMTVKGFTNEPEENKDITNYFKASLYKSEKDNHIYSTKDSNGAAVNEIGNYIKKLNYFDESDGFMRNDEFID